jgi:hypothetical protein
MSKLRRILHAQDTGLLSQWGKRDGLRARMPYYVAIALLLVLTLAYIDGGEEPIRPIAQRVDLPTAASGSE